MPAERLCFELTETSALRDLARAQHFIKAVRALGCRFALDDFGTGFCSFGYLRSLDVDYFKIDGSFVRDVETSPVALAIVRSIADIGRVLNKQTIAECAETEAIRRSLVGLGVDYAQGYALDEPMPIARYFDPDRLAQVRLDDEQRAAQALRLAG
jgi:EAL domain-containing protein (putative c-di-GMP-specific phosphodiesterase class I)